MFVNSRRLQEELVIGGSIRIKVLEITKSHVKLGVEAPANTTIRRAEETLRLQDFIGSRELKVA